MLAIHFGLDLQMGERGRSGARKEESTRTNRRFIRRCNVSKQERLLGDPEPMNN